jgi:hypothetical protein
LSLEWHFTSKLLEQLPLDFFYYYLARSFRRNLQYNLDCVSPGNLVFIDVINKVLIRRLLVFVLAYKLNFRNKNLSRERVAHHYPHSNRSACEHFALLLVSHFLFFFSLKRVINAELSELVERSRVRSFLQILSVA